MVMGQKTWSIFAMLLLMCICVTAALECQRHFLCADMHAHSDPLGFHVRDNPEKHPHACPVGHAHDPFSHTLGHGACLLAVLPLMLFMVCFARVWFMLSDCLLHLAPLTFLPFIPPRSVLYA